LFSINLLSIVEPSKCTDFIILELSLLILGF
jgi:hypothetical protein